MSASAPTEALPALPLALASRLKVALRAAESAGAILMRHLGGGDALQVEHKGAVDLVTVADREAEACVLGELALAFPEDGRIGEETDGAGGRAAWQATARRTTYCWLVDPLDGTTHFAHGHLQFCVSIGLLRDGVPCLGVVHAPARRETFVGGVGLPSTCNGAPIHVSAVDQLSGALVATGFPYDRRPRIDTLLSRLRVVLLSCQGVRRGGSAALDLCELAAGRLDAYYEDSLQPWDVAAGIAIVEAAGGAVRGFGAAQPAWQVPADPFAGAVLASNLRLGPQMATLLAGAERSATGGDS